MRLSVDNEMAARVIEATDVLYEAGLGPHIEVESDGLLSKLIKRPLILATILAIEDDVDGSLSVLLFVYEFEDPLVLLNVAEYELSRHSPKDEKIA